MTNNTVDKSKNKNFWNLIKWLLIAALLVLAGVKNKQFVREAIGEIKEISVGTIILCFILANLYFVAEGRIISRMTASGKSSFNIWEGIKCAYICAFYRLATFGSGTGIAQVFFFNTRGIPVAEATGMGLVQYTFQKITIGVMGIVSFLILIATGDSRLLEYSGYMLAGVVVISLICIFLTCIAVSKKISDMLIKLGRKIAGGREKLNKKIDEAQEAINNLQNQGILMWHDKSLFIQVAVLNIIKFACWYAIIGVLFRHEYSISILISIALMAVCNMLGCVMVAPSGIGTLEFVVAIFFATLIPEHEAIAAALVIYRFFTWIVPFVIGIVPAALLKKTK